MFPTRLHRFLPVDNMITSHPISNVEGAVGLWYLCLSFRLMFHRPYPCSCA